MIVFEYLQVGDQVEPGLLKLLVEGFATTPDGSFPTPDVFLPELLDAVQRRQLHLFLAESKGQLEGFLLLELPSAFRSVGWVVQFYATSRAARRALDDAGRSWYRARQVRQFRALNGSEASDRAYARLFGAGHGSRVVGSIHEFEVG